MDFIANLAIAHPVIACLIALFLIFGAVTVFGCRKLETLPPSYDRPPARWKAPREYTCRQLGQLVAHEQEEAEHRNTEAAHGQHHDR